VSGSQEIAGADKTPERGVVDTMSGEDVPAHSSAV
jgi:hypothetical protein